MGIDTSFREAIGRRRSAARPAPGRGSAGASPSQAEASPDALDREPGGRGSRRAVEKSASHRREANILGSPDGTRLRRPDQTFRLFASFLLFGPFLWIALVLGNLERGMALESASVYPGEKWEKISARDADLDAKRLEKARDYALTGGGSGYITRGGRLALAWGDVHRKYDLKSTSKSIGVTALGLALQDGKMRLEEKATKYHPSFGVPPEKNRATGWLEKITILHLATQTAGFDKPGGYEPLLFAPGTKWSYSDGGPNWLAECVTLVYRRDIEDLMYERVFTPLDVPRSDLRWRKNAYRPAEIDGIVRREFGSGVHASVDAMARLGLLYLRRGRWKEKQIIPESFVDRARTTVQAVVGLPELAPEKHGNASDHYGLLWWNNSDGTLEQVPRDAYWSWGLYDSLIVVIPSLDIVVSRAGKSWKRTGGGHYEVLRPFFEPICAAVEE